MMFDDDELRKSEADYVRGKHERWIYGYYDELIYAAESDAEADRLHAECVEAIADLFAASDTEIIARHRALARRVAEDMENIRVVDVSDPERN